MSKVLKNKNILTFTLVFILTFCVFTKPANASTLDDIAETIAWMAGGIGDWAVEKILLPNEVTIDKLIRQDPLVKSTSTPSVQQVDLSDLTTIRILPGSNGKDQITSVFTELIEKYYPILLLLAVLVFLVVIIYLGILMLISTAMEKAKYKQSLVGWVMGLIILFGFNFIMIFIIEANNTLAELFLSMVPIQDQQKPSNFATGELIDYLKDANTSIIGNIYGSKLYNGFDLRITKADSIGNMIDTIQNSFAALIIPGFASSALTNNFQEIFNTFIKNRIYYQPTKGDSTQKHITIYEKGEEKPNGIVMLVNVGERQAVYNKFKAGQYFIVQNFACGRNYIAFTDSTVSQIYGFVDLGASTILAEKYIDNTLNYPRYYEAFWYIYGSKADMEAAIGAGLCGFDNLLYSFKQESLSAANADKLGSTLLYIMAIVQIVWLYIVYIIRTFMISFLIFIFPIVMAIYAIDKASDNKSAVFGNWFKEFSTNVFTNSVHAASYGLIGSIIFQAATPTISTSIFPILATTEYKFSPEIRLIALWMIIPLGGILRKIFQMEGSGAASSGAGLGVMMGATSLARGIVGTGLGMVKSAKDVASGAVGLAGVGIRGLADRNKGGPTLPGSTDKTGKDKGENKWSEAGKHMQKIGKGAGGMLGSFYGGGVGATLMGGVGAGLGMSAEKVAGLVGTGISEGGKIGEEFGQTTGGLAAGATGLTAATGSHLISAGKGKIAENKIAAKKKELDEQVTTGAMTREQADNALAAFRNQQKFRLADAAGVSGNLSNIGTIGGMFSEGEKAQMAGFALSNMLAATGGENATAIGASLGSSMALPHMTQENIGRIDWTRYDQSAGIRAIASKQGTIYQGKERGTSNWKTLGIGAGISDLKDGQIQTTTHGITTDPNGIYVLGEAQEVEQAKQEVNISNAEMTRITNNNASLAATKLNTFTGDQLSDENTQRVIVQKASNNKVASALNQDFSAPQATITIPKGFSQQQMQQMVTFEIQNGADRGDNLVKMQAVHTAAQRASARYDFSALANLTAGQLSAPTLTELGDINNAISSQVTAAQTAGDTRANNEIEKDVRQQLGNYTAVKGYAEQKYDKTVIGQIMVPSQLSKKEAADIVSFEVQPNANLADPTVRAQAINQVAQKATDYDFSALSGYTHTELAIPTQTIQNDINTAINDQVNSTFNAPGNTRTREVIEQDVKNQWNKHVEVKGYAEKKYDQTFVSAYRQNQVDVREYTARKIENEKATKTLETTEKVSKAVVNDYENTAAKFRREASKS